jgi:hypothetical protein
MRRNLFLSTSKAIFKGVFVEMAVFEPLQQMPQIDVGWLWAGSGLALGWLWAGSGLALGWLWAGSGLALGWLWAGSGLALG